MDENKVVVGATSDKSHSINIPIEKCDSKNDSVTQTPTDLEKTESLLNIVGKNLPSLATPFKNSPMPSTSKQYRPNYGHGSRTITQEEKAPLKVRYKVHATLLLKTYSYSILVSLLLPSCYCYLLLL